MCDKSILLIAGALEDCEVVVPLQTIGHTAHAVCRGVGGRRLQDGVHGFRGDRTYLEARGRDFVLNATSDDVGPAD